MKILVICQYYYPEPFRVNDWCEELVKQGHEVTVVTGTPNYPMGEIYEGYQHGAKTDEIIKGVTVHRCPIVGRKSGAIHRFLNYYDFVLKSQKYVSKLSADFDVVLINQLSPVMMAKAGIKYKKKHQKKMVLYCLDLWPESLVVGGIKTNSLLYRIFKHISKRIYGQADKILISSQSFAKYLEKMFQITDTEYLPQYAEDLFAPEQCKKEYNETIDLLFAGNVGTAQSVKTVVEAARLTVSNPTIRWHVVGDGAELNHLKNLAKDLNNITFYGRMPLEEMPSMYRKADAMIVTMENNPIISFTLPGKVQSYMAAGKPIIGAINGETQRVLCEANCGLCCNAEDAETLARFACSLTKETMGQMALNSRKYYDEHFSKNIFIDRLQNNLFRYGV